MSLYQVEYYTSDITNEIIDAIIRIQQELCVYSRLRNQREAKDGLLIGHYSQELLKHYAQHKAEFYVGRNKITGQIDGHLIMTSGSYFFQRNPETFFHLVDLKKTIEEASFTYIDQIGVRFSAHKSGLAHLLYQDCEQRHRGELLLLLILREPVKNIRSKEFFLKKDYKVFGEAKTANYASIANLTSDILIKDLSVELL